MRQRLSIVVAIGALLGQACTSAPSGQLGDPPAIGAPEVEGSETVPPDEWAVPEVITEDYIRKVLTEIEREKALFWRWLLDSEPGTEPPPDVAAFIHATYIALSSQQVIDQILEQYEAADGDLPGALDGGGQYVPDEVVIHRADSACVLVEVLWDGSEAEPPTTATPRQREIISLLRPTDQPVNRTRFVYAAILGRDGVSSQDIAIELEERSLCV